MARKRRARRPGRALVLVLAAVAIVALGFLLGQRASKSAAVAKRAAATVRSTPLDRTDARRARPTAPAKAPTHEPEPVRVETHDASAPGRIAIVIDDLGRSPADVDRLLALGVPLSYAVLPWERRSAEVAERLTAAGAEILCHLPMEASGGANPGPNAIREGQTPGRIEELTRAALDALPGAAGLNNHMGSLVTADPEAIGAVLDVAAERGLFFLDSRTTKETVAYELARRRGIPVAKRDIFLDEDPDPIAIEAAFDALLAAARERGAAIAIGHPHETTLAMLERRLPEARDAGFEIVPVSFLVERGETLP